MNISITGSSGFIGKRLVGRLVGGVHTIKTFDTDNHHLLEPDSLKSFLSGVDCVVHLAGVNRGSDVEFVNVHTAGTVGLLTGMKLYCPNATIIFASTFQVHAPESVYALSKKWAEEEIAFFSQRHHIPGIVLRFSNVYGPGCKPFYNSVIATYCHQIQNGQTIMVHGDGSQKRDYIFVDDVVDAIEKSMAYVPHHRHELLDICSGTPVALSEVINILQSLHTGTLSIEYTKTKGSGVEYPYRDFSKAYRALSWRPEISLTEGLQKTLLYEAEHKET